MTTTVSNTTAAEASVSGRRGDVFVIAVGRNEGRRLESCLRSLRAVTDRVIYVDSGSRDGSVELAERLGAAALSLPGPRFTAAMGRQRGLDEAKRLFPDARYVQFIDGDCTIDPGWLAKAAAYLDSNPRVAGVFGRVREANTEGSMYSKFVDMEWNFATGPVNLHGGIAMDRLEAIDAVGGWAHDLIAGEEPDLAFRMRDLGWQIHALTEPMCTHDIAIFSLRPYLRRIVRTGHAYAEVGWKHRRGTGRYFLTKRAASSVFYGVLMPLVAVAAGVIAWRQWGVIAGLGVPAGIMTLALAKVARGFVRAARRQGADWRTTLAYAGVNVLGKFAAAWGVLRFLWLRVTGRSARIIEYKPAPAAQKAGA